jgi:MFS transporter, OFA family, oxalate/formate antiporter
MNRWVRLAAAVTAMIMIGNLQYAWTLFVQPMVFLTWGAVYALFPAVLGDMFGARHAASNYSILYSTKGLASILAGGLAALLFEASGSWNFVFYGSSALAFVAALTALLVRNMPSPEKRKEVRSASLQGLETAPAGD